MAKQDVLEKEDSMQNSDIDESISSEEEEESTQVEANIEELTEDEIYVVEWRIKRLLQELMSVRGGTTTMITIIIPPKEQLSIMTRKLQSEAGKAVNIKSKITRLCVKRAIKSAINQIRLYGSKAPKTGLIVYSGFELESGTERKIVQSIVPLKPINTSKYMCGSSFETGPLIEMFKEKNQFAFIIIDGGCTVFATLNGSHKRVLDRTLVDLPKKHGRGGQSAMRFERLRLEKRLWYVKSIIEKAKKLLIHNEMVPYNGIVVAGSAGLKMEFFNSTQLDPRIKKKIVKIIDINYGDTAGLDKAIELSQDVLKEVRYVREKKLIDSFFSEISSGTDIAVLGIANCLKALKMFAVEKLIVLEDIPAKVVIYYPKMTREEMEKKYVEKSVEFLAEEEVQRFQEEHKNDVVVVHDLTDWISGNYRKYSCKLYLVGNKTTEGAQFEALGGIGCFLRYGASSLGIENPFA